MDIGKILKQQANRKHNNGFTENLRNTVPYFITRLTHFTGDFLSKSRVSSTIGGVKALSEDRG